MPRSFRWNDWRTGAGNHAIARQLAHLDDTMRQPGLSPQRAVSTRLAFFFAAVRTGAVMRLNAVGNLLPSSRLSERSLDWVFECNAVSDAVVIGIVRRCRKDAKFRAAVQAEGFERSLAQLETFARIPATVTAAVQL